MQGTAIKAAFVSTNSITQGEQVGILWGELLTKYGVKIHFAHRTFKWNNEARGNAAVYCVILGFGLEEPKQAVLNEYATPRSEPQQRKVAQINPYLVDAPSVLVLNQSKPLSPVPAMLWGGKPTDGGFLILSDEERQELLRAEPKAEKFVRRYVGAQEFLHNQSRWCLWLADAAPAELKLLPKVMERVESVRQFRLASKAASTRDFAIFPTLFRQRAQPTTDYLIVPLVSSETRRYIPLGFMSHEVIASNLCSLIPNATPYLFGILTSEMHMAWMRQVCGRLESRFRYSGTLVYNNFPFPQNPTPKQTTGVEAAAQAVLAARAEFPTESLATLYDPLTMPPALVRAHAALDRAVDACYRAAAFPTELSRLEFLFQAYRQLQVPLLPAPPAKAKRAPRRPA